jgi:DNA-binding response OmpR family regulator
MLRGMGYRVLEAWDARTARSALARDDSVDLVLSDVVLPGGTSGPDFCLEAGTAHPGLKFLFMSGHPSKAGERIPVLAEDSALLRKPFGRKELASALRASLGG